MFTRRDPTHRVIALDHRLTLGQESVVARRLVEAGGGLKGVQGGRVMPVYRAGVNARYAGRGGDAVGSTEYGRGGGDGGG